MAFHQFGSVPAHYSEYDDDSHVDLWPGIFELMLGFAIEGLGQRYFLSFRIFGKGEVRNRSEEADLGIPM